MTFTQDPNILPQPGSRQGVLICLQIFFTTIALFVYGLRIYTRRFILHSLGNDDYIMGGAVLTSIALTINACVSTTHGWAQHLSSIPYSNIPSLLLSVYLSELLFTLCTSLAKLSILFFYLRLTVTTTYRRMIYVSIVFITLWGIIFSCVAIFQCRPISAYWEPAKAASACISPEVPLLIHGLTNTMTDVYIYILPMQMVWEVQLPKRQRIGLLLIFGAGFLVCVAGALRLYYSIITERSPDTTWEGFYLWIWEAIEINGGIVCASAPCLKSLISRILPRIFPSHASASQPLPSFETADPGTGRKGYLMTNITTGRSRNAGVVSQSESQVDLTEEGQR